MKEKKEKGTQTQVRNDTKVKVREEQNSVHLWRGDLNAKVQRSMTRLPQAINWP